MKGSWCNGRWQTCVFSPNRVCFHDCDCLLPIDAAASRLHNVTPQTNLVPELTFKWERGPQLSTLLGTWRSDYCSENHLTHAQVSWLDSRNGDLDNSHYQCLPRGRGGVRNNTTACRVLPWRLRGKQRERAQNPFRNPCSSFSIFICWILTSSSPCRSRFYSLYPNETQKWTPFVL